MKVTRTGLRGATKDITRSQEGVKSSGLANANYFGPECVHFVIGYGADGRTYELYLTPFEAEHLAATLREWVQKSKGLGYYPDGKPNT